MAILRCKHCKASDSDSVVKFPKFPRVAKSWYPGIYDTGHLGGKSGHF